jgi:2-dehydropantoate 2-reductase
MFHHSGFDAHICENIREEIWLKLLGNACFNPVSLLVGSSTDELIDDPLLSDLFIEMMNEVLELGHRLNISPEIDSRQRIAITRKLGTVKTSMLQDVEGHKPVEIEAILGALVSVADLAGAPMPRVRFGSYESEKARFVTWLFARVIQRARHLRSKASCKDLNPVQKMLRFC